MRLLDWMIMRVELLHCTPLEVCSGAVRTCWASQEKSDTKEDFWLCPECNWESDTGALTPLDNLGQISCPECNDADVSHIRSRVGEADKELIDRVGNKFKHKSVLEHLSYNFFIHGISRALLQELARHRTAKISVKSSRYTLKELKKEDEFWDFNDSSDYKRAEKFVRFTSNIDVNRSIFKSLESLRLLIKKGISNDIAKYAMPESYKTEATWTMDARNLQSFLSLRSDKAALWEIRELAHAIFNQIPLEHRYLFTDYIKEGN